MKYLLRKSFITIFTVSLGVLSFSCSDDNDVDNLETESRELTLKYAATDFIDNNVVPTYRGLADASIDLTEACEALQEAFATNSLTTELVQAACEKWIESRKYWELSEAFLYGAAADYNIDPHIDSWPLNKSELEALLKDAVRMGKMDDEYAGTYLGYGLLGFHALEYMLFENGGPRAISKYTTEELIYTVAVAGDLRNQCIRLEAAWGGLENVSEEKQEILEETELEPTFDYGYSMKNAGLGGSKYKSYLEVAQEILQGCIDIADEVANQKIGRPANGTSDDDVNYIESPYSHNSKIDFIDNILSIKNSYMGVNSSSISVSTYIASVNSETDSKIKEAINKTIAAIEICEAPFVNNRTSTNWKNSVEVCNNLVVVLEEAQRVLEK